MTSLGINGSSVTSSKASTVPCDSCSSSCPNMLISAVVIVSMPTKFPASIIF